MLQPQKVEAIYKNGVLHLLEPLEGFVEHCKVNITVDYEGGAAAPGRSTRVATYHRKY